MEPDSDVFTWWQTLIVLGTVAAIIWMSAFPPRWAQGGDGQTDADGGGGCGGDGGD